MHCLCITYWSTGDSQFGSFDGWTLSIDNILQLTYNKQKQNNCKFPKAYFQRLFIRDGRAEAGRLVHCDARILCSKAIQ